MEIGSVKQVDIDETDAFGLTSIMPMSVIVSRALPDARDGLKPVQPAHSLCNGRHGHPCQ